jgi:hypothetical protein
MSFPAACEALTYQSRYNARASYSAACEALTYQSRPTARASYSAASTHIVGTPAAPFQSSIYTASSRVLSPKFIAWIEDPKRRSFDFVWPKSRPNFAQDENYIINNYK